MSNKELVFSLVVVDFQEDEKRVQVENTCTNIGILKYLGFGNEEILKATHGNVIDVYDMITSLEDGFSFNDGKWRCES